MFLLREYFLLILCAFNFHKTPKCRLHPRVHFGEPLPIVIKDGRLLEPTDADGNIELNNGDVLTLSCETGGVLSHPHASQQQTTANIICQGGETFRNEEWLNAPSAFFQFRCSSAPIYISKNTDRKCYDNNAVIEVGYTVEGRFYPIYESCFNEAELRAVYSKYIQQPYNAFFQTKVDRPFFKSDQEYRHIPVERLFGPAGQKAAVSQLVGNMIDSYFTKQNFLARGHLAAKTDFVFAFGERATFHYVNCAPQWSGFNGGNWNTLEVDLRLRVNAAGYNVTIYTGTFGVTQLRTGYGHAIDIYLYTDENNNPVIPVPQYFYKVVYEASSKRGVVFVGINNPYYNATEAEKLVFCRDYCRNNPHFSWLTWHPNNFHEGYTFCCSVDDFRRSVPHLPKFEVRSLLS